VADYNNIVAGRTTIYSSDVYLPPANALWNPALNLSDTNGLVNVSSNWDGGILPGSVTFVRFNIADAIPCLLTNAATVSVARLGLDGPAGTVSKLIITNGGSLTCTHPDEWNSIAMNSTHIAELVVENGGRSVMRIIYGLVSTQEPTALDHEWRNGVGVDSSSAWAGMAEQAMQILMGNFES